LIAWFFEIYVVPSECEVEIRKYSFSRIDYARIVISAGGAFSQGACESAACERGPRDGANAKVLGMRRAREEGKRRRG
jgi:hypothetical protein